MEHNLGVGAIVGLTFASSAFVWNSENFSKEQKTGLLICVVFSTSTMVGYFNYFGL